MKSIQFLTVFLILIGCQPRNAEQSIALSNIELLRGDIILCSGKEFGDVSFELSCKSSVREAFNLALSLLHSFEYDEAEKAFVKVIDADPDCVMAYWGIAMSIYHALWVPPSPDKLEKGAKILEIASTLSKTPREKDYLDAIGIYYDDWENVSIPERALRVEKKMEEIYRKYDEDTEAAVFYALMLNSTADPNDKSYTHQLKAGKILEKLFQDQPNHPGIAHYIIHSYDYPGLAENALPVAKKYAEIAPASAHAQHMPSHIFTRLGLWEESIQSNLKSTSSAVCYANEAGIAGHWDEELHGMDYLVYAYLQQGDNAKALQQVQYLKSMRQFYPVNFKVAYALAAIPARLALENKDWEQAAHLELPPIEFPWEEYPWQRSIIHFARALGAMYLEDIETAEKEISNLEKMRQQLIEMEIPYQANQVYIQILTGKAWLKLNRGDATGAIAMMIEAADLEDNTSKHPVTPGEVIPARELLGEMYLVLNQPDEASIHFQKCLQNSPNRLNSLYGTGYAEEMAGNSEKAKTFYGKLLEITSGHSSDHQHIVHAQRYLRET